MSIWSILFPPPNLRKQRSPQPRYRNLPCSEAHAERILEPLSYAPTDMGANMAGWPLWTELRLKLSNKKFIRRATNPPWMPAERVGEGAVKKIGALDEWFGHYPKWLKVTAKLVRKKKKQGASLALLNCQAARGWPETLWSLVQRQLPFDQCDQEIAHIDKETKLIEPEYVQPIQGLKINYRVAAILVFTERNLIALAITAMTNEDAKLAMQALGKLKGKVKPTPTGDADRRRQECPSQARYQRHHGPCLSTIVVS